MDPLKIINELLGILESQIKRITSQPFIFGSVASLFLLIAAVFVRDWRFTVFAIAVIALALAALIVWLIDSRRARSSGRARRTLDRRQTGASRSSRQHAHRVDCGRRHSFGAGEGWCRLGLR